MDFHYWQDLLALKKKQDPAWRKFNATEGYSRLRAFFQRLKDGKSIQHCYAEDAWYQLGKPYFKVWPRMADALPHCDLNIDMEFLQLPFRVFSVLLPKRDNPLQEEGGPPLKALLVERHENGQNGGVSAPGSPQERDWTLIVSYQLDVSLDEPWAGYYFGLPVITGRTIESQIEESFQRSDKYDDGYVPSLAFVKRILRLAAGVAFFGVDRHELVAPDIPRCYEERYRQAQQTKNESEAVAVLKAAKHMGMFGWRVGSEIDLPAPEIKYLDKPGPDGEVRSLSYGHVRRGHMRMQPFGEGKKERRIQFIPPTLVRPDLPLAERHGFRIGKPAGERHYGREQP